MPKNNEVNFGDYFNLPNPGLKSYFDIVERGQPDEYRTTFARGSSIQEVLLEWEPFITSLIDEWPTLVEFENDLRSKVGPMSVMKPLSQRMTDLEHYYEDILLSSRPISDSALKAVLNEFKQVKGLTPRGQQRTVDLMKKSTNSGSPYFTKRRTVVNKTIPCKTVWNGADVCIYHRDGFPDETEWKGTAVLGWRGQEGGPKPGDVKQRIVWMFPFAVNVNELQVYQPLIESCQRFNLIPAWVSMDSVDLRVTRMFDTKSDDDVVICTDFTKFDQHFNSDLQDAACYMLRSLLNNSRESLDWIENVFPIKYNIPMAYTFGEIRSGAHGMGSGSGGTNADETLVHRALQYEAAIQNNSRLNPNSQCLGDDGLITYPGITVEDVVETYSEHGLSMNLDKQYASKHDCIYLRRWHHDQYRRQGVCVGVYSTYRALGRLMEQERFYDPDVWSYKMVALRQLSIIENVKYHPLCTEFAEFCMKRDKYRLGLDIPGFLDDIDNIAQEAIELMPDFLGYTKSMTESPTGLSSWWIVNYLKSRS